MAMTTTEDGDTTEDARTAIAATTLDVPTTCLFALTNRRAITHIVADVLVPR